MKYELLLTYYPYNRKYYAPSLGYVTQKEVARQLRAGVVTRIHNNKTKTNITRDVVRKLIREGLLGELEVSRLVDDLIGGVQ